MTRTSEPAAGKAPAGARKATKPAVPPVTPPSVAEPAAAPAPTGKLAILCNLLRQPKGATLEAMTAATGWQKHSVRGAMSGGLKRKHGLTIISEKADKGRVYRLAPDQQAES